MMLNIMWIPNMERFLSEVSGIQGEVYLHLPDDSRCSLKHSATAHQMLKMIKPGTTGLRISLSNPNEVPCLMQYMMGI